MMPSKPERGVTLKLILVILAMLIGDFRNEICQVQTSGPWFRPHDFCLRDLR
jgi:hypothetical protein